MSTAKMNIVVLLAVLGLTSGFVFGVLVPGFGRLKTKHAEIEAAAAQVKSDQGQVGNIGDIYKSILELDKETSDYRVKLPSDRRFGEFLNSLSDSLKKVQIDDYIVQLRDARRLEAESLPSQLKLAAGTTILAVDVKFETNFETLFELLLVIEKLPRVTQVEKLQLALLDEQSNEIHVDLLLHTYFHPG